MDELYPAYLNLLETDQLADRVREAYVHLSICDVCPWECQVDRKMGKLGVCRTGVLAKISSYGPHFGEETPLSGTRGSGTIRASTGWAPTPCCAVRPSVMAGHVAEPTPAPEAAAFGAFLLTIYPEVQAEAGIS